MDDSERSTRIGAARGVPDSSRCLLGSVRKNLRLPAEKSSPGSKKLQSQKIIHTGMSSDRLCAPGSNTHKVAHKTALHCILNPSREMGHSKRFHKIELFDELFGETKAVKLRLKDSVTIKEVKKTIEKTNLKACGI